jgi:rhodanese-related sulfurtransferase
MKKTISVLDLKKILFSGRSVRILDVRRRADLEAAPQTIPSAEWHDPEKTDDWIPTMPNDQTIVVYCVKGGGVSQSVADRLENKHCQVKFLEGGIKAWKEMGGAVD